MGFRDDDLATRSRVEVLEREVRELQEQNAQLQARPRASASGNSPRRSRLLVAIVALVSLALLAMVAAALVGDFMFSVAMSLFAVLFLCITGPLFLLRNNLLFVPAQHVLVLSGRQRPTPEGRQVGYRIVTSGSAFRLPVLERADLLATGPFALEAHVAGVYLRGNQPAELHVRASVRIPTKEPGVHNAVERFVGRADEEIERVAKETLEGTMREVIARMSVEELRREPARISETVRTKSQSDFERLGLHVDTLEILRVRAARAEPHDVA
ncbi:MAG: SPFH domain-containing protein [Polyangiales bacterium]